MNPTIEREQVIEVLIAEDLPPGVENEPPTFANGNDVERVQINESAMVKFGDINDPESGSLDVSVDLGDAAAFMKYNEKTNTFMINGNAMDETKIGDYPITMVITDEGGVSAEKTFTLSVVKELISVENVPDRKAQINPNQSLWIDKIDSGANAIVKFSHKVVVPMNTTTNTSTPLLPNSTVLAISPRIMNEEYLSEQHE